MKKTFLLLPMILALALPCVALAEDMPVISWETPTPTPAPTATPAPSPTPTPSPTPKVYETVKRGDSGKAVEALQLALVEHNYLYDKVDGDFGSKTEKAVKQVQADAGYAQTGIADARTQAYLDAHSAEFKPSGESGILFYALVFDSEANMLHAYFKNTGVSKITEYGFDMEQCDASRNELGSFYDMRNYPDFHYITGQNHRRKIEPGESDMLSFQLLDLRTNPFTSIEPFKLYCFEDGVIAKFTMTSYTTEDGEQHKTNQVLYCPFR